MNAAADTIIASNEALAALACWVAPASRSATAPASAQLVVYDLRSELEWAIARQAEGLAGGREMVFVGVEPGTVQIGPRVGAGLPGCLHCWHARCRANHRQARHAASYQRRPLRSPHQPLLAPARLLLATLVRTLALDASICLRVNTASLEVSRHRFLALTGCPHCPPITPDAADRFDGFPAARYKRAPHDKRLANPALTLARARALFVDRHSGLVKHVFQDHASDLVPLCCAEMADAGDAGYGRAPTAHQSELVAILEALERHAGRDARGGQASLLGSTVAMRAAYPGQVVEPHRFILHARAQYADPNFTLARYTRALPLRWCRAYSLRSGRAMLVPEQLAYYDQQARPGEPSARFVYDSSNGCSLGCCLEEAALGGLYEVVERDAYLCAWYTRIARPRIDNDSIAEPRAAALIARARAEGMHIHLFDISTDTAIPAVWAMIVDPDPHAVVKSYGASGCHARWDEAIFSALVEVCSSMSVYRRAMGPGRERALAMLADSRLVRAMPDHVLLYSLPESYPRLSFLHGGPLVTLQQCEARSGVTPHGDLGAELRRQAGRVLAVASDLLVVDQSFADLAPLGLRCVKVLAPGLLPVTFGHQYRRISYARLNQVARYWGVDTEFTPKNVNPWPHNFP